MIFADLNYLHPHGRSANVALHPGLRSHEICVNTTPTLPADRQIALDDILVGATGTRFFLRSARLGKELVVSQGHMLSPLQAPNACRLLLELSEDGYAPLAGFDWGALRMSPFLPRVVRGRAVLHPAQWSLTPERLGLPAGKDALPGRDDFYAAVQRWREQWNVPRYVSLMYMDNWLALDLEHPLSVDELYDEVASLSGADRQHVIIQEAPGGFPAPGCGTRRAASTSTRSSSPCWPPTRSAAGVPPPPPGPRRRCPARTRPHPKRTRWRPARIRSRSPICVPLSSGAASRRAASGPI